MKDSDTASFYNKEENKFCYKLRECIYSLLAMNISATNISSVIQCVLNVVGKTCEKVPARSTILNINIERFVLSQKQFSEVIPDKSNPLDISGHYRVVLLFVV